MCWVPTGSNTHIVSVFKKTMKLSQEKNRKEKCSVVEAPRTERLELILKVSGLPQAGDICTEIYRALTQRKGAWRKVGVGEHFKQRTQMCRALGWKEL